MPRAKFINLFDQGSNVNPDIFKDPASGYDAKRLVDPGVAGYFKARGQAQFLGWGPRVANRGELAWNKALGTGQTLHPVINRIDGIGIKSPGFAFSARSKVGLIQALTPNIADTRGVAGLHAAISSMVPESPAIRGIGVGSATPGVQLLAGGSVINYPLQVGKGLVTRGTKSVAVRDMIAPSGQLQTFSEVLGQKMAEMPVLMGRDLPKGIKETFKGVLDMLGDTAMYGGQALESRIWARSKQVVFHPDHPFAQRFAAIQEKVGDVNRLRTAGGSISSQWSNIQGELTGLYSDMHDKGYSMHAIKWEGMAKRGLMATRGGQTLYPGLDYGRPEKGYHQLAHRFALDPNRLSNLGWKKTLPWLAPRGHGGKFWEAPIRLGLIGGKMADDLIGDAGAIYGNDRFRRYVASYPQTITETITAPLRRVGSRQQVMARGFSPIIQTMFDAYGIDEQLRRKGSFTFANPKFFKSRVLLGESLGRTGTSDAVTSGIFKQLQKGYGISGVTANFGTSNVEYTFNLTKPSNVLQAGYRGVLVGATRLNPFKSMDFGKNVDLVARWADVMKKDPVTRNAVLTGHWMSLAKQTGKSTGKLADVLGLGGGTVIRGQRVYTAGHDWGITSETVTAVEKFFAGTGVEDAILGRRANYKGVPMTILDDAPVAIRSGTAGLKQSYGMKLRLDHVMAALAKSTSGPVGDLYKKHAIELLSELKKKNPRLWSEGWRLFGPLLNKSAPGPSRYISLTPAQYAKRFTALPDFTGGVAAADLKGTILDPALNRRGVMINLEKSIPYHMGTSWDLTSGTAKFTDVKSFFMLSAKAANINAVPETGVIYSTSKGALGRLAGLDEGLRNNLLVGGGGEGLGAEVTAYHMAARKNLFGAEGTLTPSGRIRTSGYSRLQLLSNKIDDALTVGMTKAHFKNLAGSHYDRLLPLAEAGEIYVGGVRWPMKEMQNYVPALKLRLMRKEEIAALATKVKGLRIAADDVVMAGQAVVHGWRGDFDLDALATILNTNLDAQKRLSKLHTEQAKTYRFFHRLWNTAEAVSAKVGDLEFKSRADQAAGVFQQHAVKFGTPIPETFFRARREVGWWAHLASEGSGEVQATARKALSSMEMGGMGKVTQRQFEAMDTVIGQFSQEFTGKEGGRGFKLLEALEAQQAGTGTKNLQRVIGELMTSVADDDITKLHVPSYLRKLPGNTPAAFIETTARDAAKGFAQIEPAFKNRKFINTVMGWAYGRSGEKSAGALAMAFGASPAELTTAENQALADRVAGLLGIKGDVYQALEADIEAIKGEAATRAGPAKEALLGGLGKRIMGAITNNWKGQGRMGAWGKPGLIAGGLIAAKGLSDALLPGDDVQFTDTPLPPDIRFPVAQPPRQMAVPKPSISLERPYDQAFSITADMKDPIDFSGVGSYVNNLVGGNMASGYLTERYNPTSRAELEYYIKDKMRSSF